MRELDVVVIGTGVGGDWTATLCARGGRSVAIADRRAYGGTCKLRGCDPKKILLEAAMAVSSTRALEHRGVSGRAVVDWPELMTRKRDYTEPVAQRTEDQLRDLGVETLHGSARFAGPDTIEVDGERLRAEHIVLATGARPRPLSIPGADALSRSEDFMDLDELPERVVFVGGGYIAFELAGLARCAGAEVTIVEAADRVLTGFDAELAAGLADAYRDMGVTVLVGTPVQSVERRGESLVVHAGDRLVEADIAVHGAGRVPDLEELDLERGEVEREQKGVSVDEYLRSMSNPRVYAVGDAAARGLPLTPVASREAEALAQTILGEPTVWDTRATATAVFSIPPMGSVGMSTDEASGRDDVEILAQDMSGWFSQSRVGVEHAGARVVREKETGRIVGAHLLGHRADEVINIFALAVRSGLTAEQVGDAVYAYPTAGTDVGYLV